MSPLPLPHVVPRIAATLLFLTALQAPLIAGQYGETFSSFADGATNLSPAGQLFSNNPGAAGIRDANRKELQLSENNVGGTSSAFRLPDLDPGNGVAAFSAKWNVSITGEDPLADGFSFNFGALGDLGAATLTSTAIPQEAGYGIGLSVGVTTFDGNKPGYYVRVNGQVVPGGYVDKPAADWGDLSAQRHHFEVDWHYFNGLTLKVNGQLIFAGLPTVGFVPDIGDRFVFAARTGGFDQQLRLDNIVIVTGATLTALPAGAPYHASAENPPSETAAQAFDGNVGTKWLASASTATLGAALPAPATVRAYTLASANDISIRDPRTWTFETGDNGTTWTSRGGQADQFFVGRLEPRAFLVASPAANSRFRLNITSNNGSTLTQLAEFTAWEHTPGPAFFKVFSLADSGTDSLRGALTTAGANPGQALITFSSGIAGGTITFGSRLAITDSDGVAIDASNRIGGIILSGGGARRVLNNLGTGRVILRGLTITGGNGADTRFTGNAGGLLAETGSRTEVARCTFTGNRATSGNAGAIFNGGTMTVEDSTFEGNSAFSQAGGLQSERFLQLIRCTITGNSCGSYGGGIHSKDRLILRHCTVFNNAASTNSTAWGGALDVFDCTLTLENSILAGNLSRGAPQDLSVENSTIDRLGRNIVQRTDKFGNFTETGPEPVGVDPLLGLVGDYGGPTRTVPLTRNSPARDASLDSTDIYDQRGSPRLGAPDLGSYETGVSDGNYTAWIWETLPAAATAGQHDSGEDFDGDGATNGEEWQAETDAGAFSSALRFVSMDTSGGVLSAVFPSVPGRIYRLQSSDDLTPPQTWTDTGDVITGDGNTKTFGPLPSARAYRVTVDPR
jgi:predicted outer membrane repeat protein